MAHRSLTAWAALATLLWECAPGSPSGTRAGEAAEYVPMPGRADLPFSALVRVGPMLYLSGQLGTDSTG